MIAHNKDVQETVLDEKVSRKVVVALEDGVIVDIFTPIRKDFL